jgi:membrane-associated phospholipid phosphatase
MTAANGIKPESGGAVAVMLRRCTANVVMALMVLARPSRIYPQPSWLPSRQLLAIAAGIFAAAMLIVMIFIDAAAINAVAHLPRWLISVFDWLTDFGKSGWFLWPIGILFLVLAALPQSLTRMSQLVLAAMMVRLGFLFVAIGAPSLFVTIVKRIIGRGRPLVTGIADPFVFDPFKWSAAYAGLPSGHTTTAVAALIAFGTLWPRARPVFLIYALVIAASRVIVTAHYPSDVLAGAVVGTIGALMVRRWFALRHLGFSVGPDGVLHQYPGPSLKRIKSVARELLAQ